MDEKLHCCYIGSGTAKNKGEGCPKDAEFEIYDLADFSETQITHACIDHVGELLGHDESVGDDAEDRWEIRALA